MKIVPDIEVNTYYTSLKDSPEIIETLYAEHGTSEQFHSELKSDMDLERLPSGKFETNDLVLHFGILAYNILRIIGQESLKEGDAPVHKKAQRRRIRKVIQNLITIASRLIFHANRFNLGFQNTARGLKHFSEFIRLLHIIKIHGTNTPLNY
jgi:hypothetical protein